MINFESNLVQVGSTTILLLPPKASAKLPSRGMTMVQGTLNGQPFKTPLEPDGRGSHWVRVASKLGKPGGKAKVAFESTKDWPEPPIPNDLKKALGNADKKVQDFWIKITPMARWDWLRWINSTSNIDTRKHRITVALSKLSRGERRPCCFNRTMCTDPSVSKNGMLNT